MHSHRLSWTFIVSDAPSCIYSYQLLSTLMHSHQLSSTFSSTLVYRLSQEREIALYCDFHGHSRQQNVFIYGCEDRKNLEQGFKERVFPMMMSKNCKDKVSFKSLVIPK